MSAINTTPTVTLEELRRIIPAIGVNVTPVIQSEPGCGKTSILKTLEKDLGDGYDYIYVDCPAKDMSDIAMTIPNHETKSLEHYVGSLFKLDTDRPKVILLDEFLKTNKLLQIIFTRLILERHVGDKKLPDGSIVFATSNNTSDGVGDNMMAHVGNRVCLFKMEKPDAEAWLPWAENNGVHYLIRTWVKMFPKCLNSYTTGNQDDNPYIFNPRKPMVSFVSPRSLEKAGYIVAARDVIGDNATMAALAGTLGASAAGDMAAFLSMERQLPRFKDILDKPSEIDMPTENAVLLMLMNQATDNLKTQAELDSFMTFVNRIPNSELQAVFFTMMCRGKNVKLARNNEEISAWAAKNYDLF